VTMDETQQAFEDRLSWREPKRQAAEDKKKKAAKAKAARAAARRKVPIKTARSEDYEILLLFSPDIFIKRTFVMMLARRSLRTAADYRRYALPR
jgi:hypothetical protein